MSATGRSDSAPQKGKEETLRALNDLIEAAAAANPLLLLFEDLHWGDPTTLELIGLLLGRLPRLRALLVITHRPEFQSQWAGSRHIASCALDRLDSAQIEAVATRVAGDKPLPAEVVQQIVAKTDGVPLFVEELTKVIVESELVKDCGDRYVMATPAPTLAIPSTLRDSLMARLDRLGPAKEVAQIGACIGREFGRRLLSLVCRMQSRNLDDAHARTPALYVIGSVAAYWSINRIVALSLG